MKIDDEILKNWGYHGHFFDLANQTVHFHNDSERKLYQKNIKDPDRKKILETSGWTDTNVTYTFNSDGFRSDEFNQECYILTAGCSQSFGHSLDLESMWAKKLCDHYECAHMNVAIPGSAWKNVAMRIGYWVSKLKPKVVAVLSPPMYRLGWVRHYNKVVGMSHTQPNASFMETKLKSKMFGNRLGYITERPIIDMLNNENVTYNMISSIEFIKKICKENSSECLILDYVTFNSLTNKLKIIWPNMINYDFSNTKVKKKIKDNKTHGLDLARDLDHNGRIINDAIFKYFKKQISKIK